MVLTVFRTLLLSVYLENLRPLGIAHIDCSRETDPIILYF